MLEQAVTALPWDIGAQVAEAAGCRAALGLLAELRVPTRAARIVGDNLAVVRFGAGTGRLRRPQMQAQIDQSLAHVHAAGWRLQWIAVRRRLNQAADRQATAGVHWAARLHAQGRRTMAFARQWLHGRPPHGTAAPAPASVAHTQLNQ